MALIDCPECGGQVSDNAVTCPHCGFPINKENPLRPRPAKDGISADLVLSRTVAGVLIFFGAAYVLSAFGIGPAANTTALGEGGIIPLLVETIGGFAALTLPITMWWMWKTFHLKPQLQPEDYEHIQLSDQQESSVARLHPDKQEQARMNIRRSIVEEGRKGRPPSHS